MKKLILNYLSIAILSGVLLSCAEEESGLNPVIDNNNVALADFPFSVENQNGVLSFPSMEDYDNAISYLNSIGDSKLPLFEEALKFRSLRQLGDASFDDEILNALLSVNKSIIIQGKTFQLDTEEGIVRVNDNSDLKSSSIQTYSVDDDVLDIVFNGASPENHSTSDDIKLKSLFHNKSKAEWSAGGSRKVKAKVTYQKAGIYFSLQAKITKENWSGGDNNIEYSVVKGSAYCRKKGWGSNCKDNRAISQKSQGGNGREYSYRPYSNRRGLRHFKYEVDFYFDNNDTGDRFYSRLKESKDENHNHISKHR